MPLSPFDSSEACAETLTDMHINNNNGKRYLQVRSFFFSNIVSFAPMIIYSQNIGRPSSYKFSSQHGR